MHGPPCRPLAARRRGGPDGRLRPGGRRHGVLGPRRASRPTTRTRCERSPPRDPAVTDGDGALSRSAACWPASCGRGEGRSSARSATSSASSGTRAAPGRRGRAARARRRRAPRRRSRRRRATARRRRASPRRSGSARGPCPSARTRRAAGPRGRSGARGCPPPPARAGAARACAGLMPSQRPLELAEARPALGQVADHEHRPLAADDLGGTADGAIASSASTASLPKTSLTEVMAQASVTGTSRSSVPRTTVSVSAPPAASSASNRSSTAASGAAAGGDEQVAARDARPRRPGCRPARRARAGRRAPAGRRRRASGARRAAARARRRAAAGPPPRRAPSASTRVAQRRVGGQGEDQPALEPDGVEAEQPPGGVDQRAAGGAARQRRGVLDRAGDAPAARAAERAAGRRTRGRR